MRPRPRTHIIWGGDLKDPLSFSCENENGAEYVKFYLQMRLRGKSKRRDINRKTLLKRVIGLTV